jgi:hypothetical protein
LPVTRRELLAWLGVIATGRLSPCWGAEASGAPAQPYFAEVTRAVEALAALGAPLDPVDAAQIARLARQQDATAVAATESILNRYTLARLSIEAAGNLHVAAGGAPAELVEQGWRLFLVRVDNPAGRTDPINVSNGWYYTPTPAQLMPGTGVLRLAQQSFLLDTLNPAPLIEKAWFMAQLHEASPSMIYGLEVPATPLSGLAVQYHVLQVFSRDAGRRAGSLALTVFPKTGATPRTASRSFQFDARSSRVVTLSVRDVDGRGCMASLTIRDARGQVYPPLAMRLAPDMSFHEQVYRGDGETLRLPDGEYVVEGRRGPEYLPVQQKVRIDDQHQGLEMQLQRWIDPTQWGWYAGDPHIHAGGCLHYQVPSEGVSPETMIRHLRGEGLSIGDVLSWGPSWYYQKQFFSGHAASPPAALEHPELQRANNTTLVPHSTTQDADSQLRYDVEVSGFPSSHAGHLVLLRLTQQDYPGTSRIEQWPSWNLPILQWAHSQGAVAGYAHCGLGMRVDSTELPNFDIPPMDSVGTQEAIIDVTHGQVDFLAGCDTQPVAELNAWYHLLNCGFRLAFLGETDYPCLSGERLGVGRTYVKLDQRPRDDAGYQAWVQNLQRGRLYCGDGRSHVLAFTVDGHAGGGDDVALTRPGGILIEARVAARLEPQITPETEGIREPSTGEWAWGWHLEKARVGATREVMVELIVNGEAVERQRLLADGTPRTLQWRRHLARSSWVALRILPSVHTHPVFVHIARQPIRASRRSAQWCRSCVDKVWEVKSPFIRATERPAAQEAFDHARRTYEMIAAQSDRA